MEEKIFLCTNNASTNFSGMDLYVILLLGLFHQSMPTFGLIVARTIIDLSFLQTVYYIIGI